MWEVLEKVLIKFQEEEKVNYYRQGSRNEGESLEDSFLTFWNSSTPESSFYDNEATRAIWTWQIYIYTSDPSKLYILADKFLELAKEEGFILQGRANDIASGIEDYVGRFITIKYINIY